MLFLVKTEVKRMPAIALEEFLGLVVREWEFVQHLKKQGQIQAVGKLAGRRGAVAIFDVESPAELDRYITQLPLFPHFTDVQVTPLSYPEEALALAKRMKNMFNSIAKKSSLGNQENI